MKVVVMWLLLLCAASAQAVQTYTYTGNPFTMANAPLTTADFVTVQFTLDTLVPDSVTDLLTAADSFEASVGGFSLALADIDADVSTALIRTNVAGGIIGWVIDLRNATVLTNSDLLVTCAMAPEESSNCSDVSLRDLIIRAPLFDGPERASNIDSPGVWNVVPEPSTLSLSALGLSGFGALRRRRRAAA